MPSGTRSDLEIRSVTKRFSAFTAVDEVSFTVPDGAFFSILGPSGCGKTTLMRMIAGFLKEDAGDILIAGRSIVDLPPNRRPVSMIFQHLALFPMMSVGENIAYGLRRRRVGRSEIGVRVTAMLDRVGLSGAADKRIDQLSGGQKQRVAIARSLVLEPDLLLLDEPLGALDLKLREHMKVELKQLQAEIGTTFVYITHDQSEALVMSDKVAVMNAGRFEQIGTPRELYYEPATAFVAGFVGASNGWTGTIDGIDGDRTRIRTEAGLTMHAMTAQASPARIGDRVRLFVRPEAIHLALAAGEVAALDNRFSGTVAQILFDGANSSVTIKAPGAAGPVTVLLPQTSRFRGLDIGAAVHFGWGADQAKCFGDAS
ncbi:MAG: ABC transporter ATP-binding protein [Hyphomicrobiales bacterium]